MAIAKKFVLTLGFLIFTSNGIAADSSNYFRVTDHIPGPDGRWDHILVDQTHDRAYIAHAERVTAIELASGKVIDNFARGSQIHTALPINGGDEVLITNGADNTAAIVNSETGAIVAAIATGTKPDAAIFDAATKLVLVMNNKGGDITLVDPKLRKLVGSIAIGGALEEAAVNGRGLAYVNVEDKNETVVVDIERKKIINRFKLDECDGPTGIVFTSMSQLVIACDGSVQLREAEDGKLVANFKIGRGADGVAYDEINHLAFIPSGATGTLAIISVDTSAPQLIETVDTQISARTIAFNSKTGKIYLPAAKFGPKPNDGSRPSILPGSFEVLVVEKK